MFDDPSHFFEQALFIATGRELQLKDMQMKGGGCINQTVHLSTSGGDFFIKWNDSAGAEMFEAEAKGLALLKQTGALPVPAVIGQGQVEGRPFLLLQYLDSRSPSKNYWQALGQGLAQQHASTQDQYGLDHNNYIGRLPQNNEPLQNWTAFFIQRRLEPQLGLAYYNQQLDKAFLERFRKLYPRLEELLVEEPPALLHGDLWSGNVMAGPEGAAWIIDPAVYYGHREAELAFTRLFGGFDPAFYSAYQEVKPLEKGWEERFDIYNLYPLLVHVNLFGAGYLSGVEQIIRRYC
ncbi:fructosamine kinase family protein [Cesiribacter sp. SM1]|uniref:fructosamine kinase family protein n=1 Tax=Cesiribacter sp. SM1 TaxID=2861196 RepID=UPI001CD3C530|nr:fructosamine kinase family protein [Cesiribacter sp. SM1]